MEIFFLHKHHNYFNEKIYLIEKINNLIIYQKLYGILFCHFLNYYHMIQFLMNFYIKYKDIHQNNIIINYPKANFCSYHPNRSNFYGFIPCCRCLSVQKPAIKYCRTDVDFPLEYFSYGYKTKGSSQRRCGGRKT